jgi:hypothetical protein
MNYLHGRDEMFNKIILVSGLLSLTTTAFGTDVYSTQFQTIQEIELVEVVENEFGEEVEVVVSSKDVNPFRSLLNTKAVSPNLGGLPGVIMATKDLIALGQQIYKIVEAGRPSVSVKSEPFEVLPRNNAGVAISAMELSNWNAPFARKYRVNTKNYLGTTPASFEFILIFSHGGQHNGKGKYITGAQLKPTNVNVKWGYSLDASFKVQSIMNAGSKGSPVAAAVISIDYKISTVLQENSASKMFYINGNGQVQAY